MKKTIKISSAVVFIAVVFLFNACSSESGSESDSRAPSFYIFDAKKRAQETAKQMEEKNRHLFEESTESEDIQK